MESHVQTSPKQECPVDNNDAKDVSKLSMILVATIQEAKDRISQIEYIFCSQIYPKVLAKSIKLNRIHAEAIKAAEDEWRERENDLLLEVKQLQLEKQQADEEKWFLKSEKAKLLRENEEKVRELRWKVDSQLHKIDEPEKELAWKSEEVDEAMKMKQGFVEMYQSKPHNYRLKRDKQEEEEKNTKTLTAELNSHKKKVDELQQEHRKKGEEVARTKELTENLKKKTEMLMSDIVKNEKLLMDQKEDNKLLLAKLRGLEENVGRLQEEVRKKTEEVQEGRKLQERLLQQMNSSSSETLTNKQLLLDKVKGLKEKDNELRVNLSEKRGDGAGGMDLNEKLHQEIELRASEFMAEKKKRRDVIDTSKDIEVKKSEVSAVDCETNKVKHELYFSDNLDNGKGVKPIQTSNFLSPPSSFIIALNCPSNVKSAPAAGTKRHASSRRDTRSRQCQGGSDPHDDFLDTPNENVRGNLKKAVKEEFRDLPIPAAKDMNLDCSDDETQDMNVDPGPQRQQNPGPMAGKGGFKYVEPVRKKAERENLKGVECKQCKKFYDAVLPNDGGMESDGGK